MYIQCIIVFLSDIARPATQPDACVSESFSSTENVMSSNGTWPNAGADTCRTSSLPLWTRSGAGRCSYFPSPSFSPGYSSLLSGGSSSSPMATSTLRHQTPPPQSRASITSTPLPAVSSSPSRPNTQLVMAQEPPMRNALKRSSLCACRALSVFSSKRLWYELFIRFHYKSLLKE